MAQGKTPEKTGENENNGRGDHELEHEPAGLLRADLIRRRAGIFATIIDRDDPAEDEAEQCRENDIGIARDIEEIEIAVNEPLRANDPEADRGQLSMME